MDKLNVKPLMDALVLALTTLPDCREPGSRWAVATERRRSVAAVRVLLCAVGDGALEADDKPVDISDFRRRWRGDAYRMATVVSTCAPWAALRRAAEDIVKVAKAYGWDRFEPISDCHWQTEWPDELDLSLRWDDAMQTDVPDQDERPATVSQ